MPCTYPHNSTSAGVSSRSDRPHAVWSKLASSASTVSSLGILNGNSTVHAVETNRCGHEARMGRSEADILVGKPEDRKRLGDRNGIGGSQQNWASMSRCVKDFTGSGWVPGRVLLKSAMCFGFHTKKWSISGPATRKGACRRLLRWRQGGTS